NQFFVITKTIISPRFSVKFGNNGGFQVSPQFKNDLAGANLSIADNSSIALLLEHRSDVPLTFAFVCHQIKIAEDGKIYPLIETGKVPPLTFGATSRPTGGAVLLTDSPVMLDIR
ncbi:MAG: hypothetical protein AAB316_19285, partial [Bacteroidota bacterium]